MDTIAILKLLECKIDQEADKCAIYHSKGAAKQWLIHCAVLEKLVELKDEIEQGIDDDLCKQAADGGN